MASSNLYASITAAFIDLATFDEMEKYMYAGQMAVSYFVRKVRKSTWFSSIPALMTVNGVATWGQQFDSNLSRAGDYIDALWVRWITPRVQINQTQGALNHRLRWTRNLGHNVLLEVQSTFNDLVAMRLDSFFLDFWAQLTIPGGKQQGYDNMIGNVNSLINPLATAAPAPGITIDPHVINCPIPLFFCRDSGVALPVAALPYNEMKVRFSFRDWTQLLIVDDIANGVSTAAQVSDLAIAPGPNIQNFQVWTENIVVGNDERRRMGKKPRDILIEQVQTASQQSFDPLQSQQHYDIRFAHAIKALMFAIRNITNPAEWSNYTSASPVPQVTGVDFMPAVADDPILVASLAYENTVRCAMPVDYFHLIQPWYKAPSMPNETGYHLYSYTLDLVDVNPKGSTNYGKLTGVSIEYTPSQGAISGASSTGTFANPNPSGHEAPGQYTTQTFQHIMLGLNHNIVRINPSSTNGSQQQDVKWDMCSPISENIVKHIVMSF